MTCPNDTVIPTLLSAFSCVRVKANVDDVGMEEECEGIEAVEAGEGIEAGDRIEAVDTSIVSTIAI